MYAAGPGTTPRKPRVSDWTTEATDVIERTVGVGARPNGGAGRRPSPQASCYGLLAGLVAIPAIILLLIGAFRGLVLLEQGLGLGGVGDARRNLRDRRGVLLDQAQSLIARRSRHSRTVSTTTQP